VVVNGAGAAGIACLKLIQTYGAKKENSILCDTRGVCFKGRKEGMNPYKEELAIETHLRTFPEACVGADVIIGVSGPGVITKEILKTLAPKPIIFAMANPEPEIRPEVAKAIRPDCIIATGRSDYPNQINNVMCFPFLFRAALDSRATQINEEMKMAAAKALANLAREPVPSSVKKAIPGREFKFGQDYIIPTPFDPRLITELPVEIVKAAMRSGVA
jgi:malate dehydrogenase (oxaloacetate-decarboxylating)(NADP+)